MQAKREYTDDELIDLIIKSKSIRSYWKYVGILRKRASDELFEKCKKLTESKLIAERIIGVDVLAQMSSNNPKYCKPFSKRVCKLYLNMLKTEKEAEVLSSVLYGIGHNNESIKSKKDLSRITSFKNHKSVDVRHALAFALHTINNKIAINTLIYLSKDRSSDVRNWATFGLNLCSENNEEIKEALRARLNDKHRETRLEAIEGLARRREPGIKNVVEFEIRENGEFGESILNSVAYLKDKSLIAPLEDLLIEVKNDSQTPIDRIRNLEDFIAAFKNDDYKKLNNLLLLIED